MYKKFVLSCFGSSPQPLGTLDVLGTVPVQETVCLEGFYFRDGYFYQSNGWYGESALVKIDPETG